jgi:hypothetical protein
MKNPLLAVVMVLCAASPARAQVAAGLNELSLSANLSGFSGGGESTSAFQLNGAIGHFFTRTVEVGAQLSLNKFEDVDLFGTLGAFGSYHFGMEGATTVPFVGAQAGLGFGGDDNPINYGAFGGLKFFLGQAGALTGQALLQRTSIDDADVTQYGILVGISLFFM